MNKKVENIGNDYTNTEEKKKKQAQMRKRIVKRRVTLFGGILLLFILVLVVMLFSQTQRNKEYAQERKHKEAQYQKQQDEEIALKEKLNNLNDKDYIEKVARDDFYLSNDGEVIFKLPKEDNKKSKKDSE